MTKSNITPYKRICQEDGCHDKHYSRGYCRKHYQQIKTKGEIYRSCYDPNKFTLKSDICEIELYNSNAMHIATAIIDAEDYLKCKHIRWHFHLGYAIASGNLRLHRYILNLGKNDAFVDHINRNKLDNRKINLRLVTARQNVINTDLQRNNTSGYRGVVWYSDRDKWAAQICVNYKNMHLGLFKNKIDAAIAYNKAAEEHFGEFAVLNDI